jgi:ParB family chromosome partitioning protein
LARPDFRSQAAQRLATERTEHTPALIDLLQPEDPTEVTDVRRVPVERVGPGPYQPRQVFDEDALQDLAASIREHGVLQPILVRPRADGGFQIVAGERRWRAAKLAGLTRVPVIVEHIDEESALEIAIIENLQREDISPLEEADTFERMTSQHGYSIRKLAQKLGKDKGYVENRLRLADAPPEVRQLVATRSDTLSHAYELMKVDDPRKRRRLARQVASGELSLVKLRQRIEGRPSAEIPPVVEVIETEDGDVMPEAPAEWVAVPVGPADAGATAVDIDQATEHLAAAVNELARALISDDSLSAASISERQQFAKFLTIAKIKLENAIAVVRAGGPRDEAPSVGGPTGEDSGIGAPRDGEAANVGGTRDEGANVGTLRDIGASIDTR